MTSHSVFVQAGASTGEWYHGSPDAHLRLDNRTLYLTRDKQVALSYANGGTSFASKFSGVKHPTLYVIDVKTACKILDLRLPEHQRTYTATRLVVNKLDSYQEDPLPKLESAGFISTHTQLPGYGNTPLFKQAFDMFDGVYVDEGYQGTSLAVFCPFKSLIIVSVTPVP